MSTLAFSAASKRPAILRYGVAVVAIAAAIANNLVAPIASPLATFVLAVIVATWFGGTRAGILATVLAVPTVAIFLTPHPSLNYLAAVATRVGYFIAIAAFIIWVVASERRAVQRLRDDIAKRQGLEAELRLVIDTIPAMAWTLLPDGRLEFLNRRWLEYAGLSLAQALDQGNSTMHPEDGARMIEKWREVRDVGASFEEEIRLRRADGEYRWFLVRTVPLRDQQGKILRWYGMSFDIEGRKRAEQALRDSAGHLQHLSRRLLEVQEEERRHLSRELHDEFGQLLASTTLHLHAARAAAGDAARANLDQCMSLLERAGTRVRSLALELRPTMLETAGLDAAMHWLADQHRRQTGVGVHLAGGADVSGDSAIACFRVAQEALTNVVRHAKARNVWIELTRTEDALQLTVRDDGVGFEVERTLGQAATSGRLGLLGMRERVQILNGSLEVDSRPGRGTRIRIVVPVAEAAVAEPVT